MPDYQGGNQPPLDQNGGVNIYNTPAQGTPQQPGQTGSPQPDLQPGQNADGTWERAANGERQPIDHGPAEYTHGPGKPNPDYEEPAQQGGSQQGGQQDGPHAQQDDHSPGQESEPSEAPRSEGDNNGVEERTDERQQKCQSMADLFQVADFVIESGAGGGTRAQPARDHQDPPDCDICPPTNRKMTVRDDPCPIEHMGEVYYPNCKYYEKPVPPNNTHHGLTSCTAQNGVYNPVTQAMCENGLGYYEREVCLKYAVSCGDAAYNRPDKMAVDLARRFLGDNDDGNRSNAAQHCIWAGLMAAHDSQEFARDMLQAHEWDYYDPKFAVEKYGEEGSKAMAIAHTTMDQWNNATGRMTAARTGGNLTNIVNECVQMAKSAQVFAHGMGLPHPSGNTSGNTLVAIFDKKEN
ncbi:hypothetical protein P5V47_03450 [Mycobacteroides abscessus subsp. massiliense]|nr:hypothetical protein [Mycobacteroides abscessus]MDO3297746.1 hypothetical protein [Mycobacteroides abscessus subsp. massiliense]